MKFIYFVVMLYSLCIVPSWGVGALIEDAELNNTMRVLTAPLIKASGQKSTFFHFHIVDLPIVNAFTGEGHQIYITTKLIETIDNVNAFQGIVAHEMGHAALEHIPRSAMEAQKDFYTGLASLFVLIPLSIFALPAAEIASGIFGSILLTTSSVIGAQLSYSRSNETLADNYALDILRKSKIDPYPLIDFMQQLKNYSPTDVIVYFQTHPAPAARIQHMENSLKLHPYTYTHTPKLNRIAYKRMQIKLIAYLMPHTFLKKYAKKSTDPIIQYGQSIAYLTTGQLHKSLSLIQALTKQYPNDPFFIEIQANDLRNLRQYEKAKALYNKLLVQLPWANSIKLDYITLLLSTPQKSNWKTALKILEKFNDPANQPYIWQLYLKAYGLLKKPKLVLLARAKFNVSIQNCNLARINAIQLKNESKKDSQNWYVANDIIQYCKSRIQYYQP